MGFFRLNPEKALQAAAVLLRQERTHRMNYMRLLKLLYLADRLSLQERGRSITNDRAVAMQRGPLPSGVFDIIKEEHTFAPRWSSFIERDGFDVALIEDPGNADLSKVEIATLLGVTQVNRGLDEWDLVLATHQLPEWRKNDPGDSSKDIPIEDILEAIGRSDDAASIIEDAETSHGFDRFFEAHHGR